MTGDADIPSVLIAEDEPLARMALRAQVEALGYTVVAVARDGAEAIALGRCLPADVAVFDMKMPARTGIDAAVELFQDAPTPVVLLTGFGAADLPSPLPTPPIFAVLTKPIGLVDLRGGLDGARAAFGEWMDEDPARASRVRQMREERRLIQRAILRQEDDASSRAEAAARLLDRARSEGTPPLDFARRILDRD